MLRLLLLALILANAAYFAWSNGLLRTYGFAPAQQNEPQRLAQQIRPEAIRVLSESELKRADTQAQSEAAPKECLQVGLFDDAQADALRPLLEKTLPEGAWQLDTVLQPARWIVYMGKYPNAEALAKKRAELSNLNLKIEGLNNPALEIGLSLGGFDSKAAANAELARLNLRGIRTAHVVQEREESHASLLRLPVVTEAQKGRLDDLKPALAGKTWHKCGG
jgi:hypothetical protein